MKKNYSAALAGVTVYRHLLKLPPLAALTRLFRALAGHTHPPRALLRRTGRSTRRLHHESRPGYWLHHHQVRGAG